MSFIPLSRVEEGERLVWGFLDETPDRDGETFDYASSKPHFERWSAEMRKASGGANLGNIRAMHTRIAAGKLVDIQFDDANKRIALCGRVVDDGEWSKVRHGVYTGFSPGGKLERFRRGGERRYTAKPQELSLVDLPANPNAGFVMVKGAGLSEEVAFAVADDAESDSLALAEAIAGAGTRADFTGIVIALGAGALAKMWAADVEIPGSELLAGANPGDEAMAKRAFSSAERKQLAKSGKALPDGSFPIETKADVANAVHAFGRAKDKAAAKAHIVERAKALEATDLLPSDWDGSSKAADAGDDAKSGDKPMKKGLFTVGNLSQLLAELACLAEGVTAEAEAEGDASPLPAALADWIGQGADILTAMANEESQEVVARLHAAVIAMPAVLSADAAAGADDESDAGMAKRAHRAVAHMAKMAGQMAGLREDLAVARGTAALLADQVAKLSAEPQPPKARLRAVPKGTDLGDAGDAGDAAEDAAIEAMPPGIAKATALQKRALARATGH